MKKIISSVLLIFIAATSFFALAPSKASAITVGFGDIIFTQTCEDSAHAYSSSCDSDCDVCGATRTVTHSYGTTCVSDESGHQRVCRYCGALGIKEGHIPGASATASTPQTCMICGYVIQEATGHDHNYSSQYSRDDEHHWYECSICGDRKAEDVHKYATACATDCKACGYTRTVPHYYTDDCDETCNSCGATRTITHSYGSYMTNETHHWRNCSVCGVPESNEPHLPGAPASETEPQKCTICDYIITPAYGHIHNYSDAYSSNENLHWYECTGCGDKKYEDEHRYGDPCDIDCGICGYVRVPLHSYTNACDDSCNYCGATRLTTHFYTSSYEKDDVYHWRVCGVCGLPETAEPHVPGEPATETLPQVCTVCALVLESAIGHTHHIEYTEHDEEQHWYPCTICGVNLLAEPHSYENRCDAYCEICDYTRKVEHPYDDGTVMREPTEDRAGRIKYTCTECGKTKLKSIDALGDDNRDDGDSDFAINQTVIIISAACAGVILLIVIVLIATRKKKPKSPSTDTNIADTNTTNTEE